MEHSEANPAVRMVGTRHNEVHALVDPSLLLDVLHNLRDSHDARPSVCPAGAEGLGEGPDHFKESGHEDSFNLVVFERSLVQLRELLRQPIQIFFADLHCLSINLIVVITVILSSLCPNFDVLLNLKHPLDVQADHLLKQTRSRRFAEVLGEATNEGHQRFHGAMSDLGVVLLAAQHDETSPEFLQTIRLEELWFLGCRTDKTRERVFQLGFSVVAARENLEDIDHGRHDRHECLRALRCDFFDELKDQLRAGSSDLCRRTAKANTDLLHELSTFGHQAISDGFHELLQDHKRGHLR
mmetsp:Transcript_61363/g.163160  ORF Transcript_61363/g.163160 Transcript_61363/m.163160 type:complete len:297 (+) Transcript_61363:2261-3151(+)